MKKMHLDTTLLSILKIKQQRNFYWSLLQFDLQIWNVNKKNLNTKVQSYFDYFLKYRTHYGFTAEKSTFLLIFHLKSIVAQTF